MQIGTKINHLLGAVLSLLVIAGFTHDAAAQGDIVFYAPVVATNISKKGVVSYSTNRQVLTMNADGSNVRQVTFGTQDSYHATWRPGRTHILFFRKNATSTDLCCMNSDGSGVFVIATGTGGSGADWSPDGNKVCYPGHDALGQWGLVVVNVDPSARRNKVGTPVLLWSGSTYGPAWSPDGNRIAFSSYPTGGTPYMTVLDLTTGTASTLDMAHSLLPSWDSTGNRLAFVGGANLWQLYVMNADLSGLTQVTDYNISVLWPSWSDDDTQIAFRLGSGKAGPPPDGASLYKLTLATGELSLLRDNADHPDWRP